MNRDPSEVHVQGGRGGSSSPEALRPTASRRKEDDPEHPPFPNREIKTFRDTKSHVSASAAALHKRGAGRAARTRLPARGDARGRGNDENAGRGLLALLPALFTYLRMPSLAMRAR